MVQDIETPRRSLKEKQRQEREELILQASEEILSEKGYSDTSMDEIAARVGIAKGTLYLHFTSKEDLVIALLERDMQAFVAAVDAAVAASTTPRETLETLLRTLYTGLLGKRFLLFTSLTDSGDMRRRLMERKERLQQVQLHLQRSISQLLEQGKAAGEFDTTIPTEVMLSLFFSLLPRHGSELYNGHMTSEELVTQLIHFYFKGIDA